MLKQAVRGAKGWVESGARKLEDAIRDRRKSIAVLKKDMEKAEEAGKKAYSDPIYVQKMTDLKEEANELNNSLNALVTATNNYRKSNIFDPFNKEAEELLKGIKPLIVKAKCRKIKTKTQARVSTINVCMEEKISKIDAIVAKKKGSSGSSQILPSGCNLSISSTGPELQGCKVAYRAKYDLRKK
ncbi:MAG TPA: hypothetical protein DD412_00565 [Holosporales bacterium]|nr:hypothetical protein [Holosporales bacterium]